MPVLARFYGMIVKMYFLGKEHNPPHVHVIYGEYMGAIEIQTGRMLEGDLPNKALSLAVEWIHLHESELLEIWETQNLKNYLRLNKSGSNPYERSRFLMFHKVKAVSPLPDYQLLVVFSEGVTKRYHVKPLFQTLPVFLDLQNIPSLFEQVVVDAGGYGISWNDDLDLACDELWENGDTYETAFDHLISFADATALWGLSESTLRKAVSYGKLKDGIDVKKFGKQWIVTRDAMQREYGEPQEGQLS